MTVKCPYCSKELEKPPQRKAKCPHCKQPIYVRKNNPFSKTIHLTEGQAKGLDYYFSLKYYAKDAGVSDSQYDREYKNKMNDNLLADMHDKRNI